MTEIQKTTITDFATGQAVPVITITAGGKTEYATVSDAWGKAIADLMDALDVANERIAALEAERGRAFKAGVEVAAIMDRNCQGDD